jgi:glucokinase
LKKGHEILEIPRASGILEYTCRNRRRRERNMVRYAVGIDLGGTFLKGGIVSERGELLEMQTTPSEAAKGPERILENLLSTASLLLERAKEKGVEPAGIGVVSPGVIDPAFGGIAGGAENLPGWEKVPFMRLMDERFGLPVSAHNDVTSHVLGEARFGAGRGKRNIVMASFGTGIGGGIIVDGVLCSGAIGYAGEIGHIAVHAGGHTCACGTKGCWEEYASIRGILRIARSVIALSSIARPKSSQWETVRPESAEAAAERSELARITGDGPELTLEAIFEAARRGDGIALRIVDEVGRETAVGIGGLINVFNPEVFIVGGGVAAADSASGDRCFDAIKKHLPEWTLKFSLRSVELVKARLGYEAGIVGASVLVFEGINAYRRGAVPKKRSKGH